MPPTAPRARSAASAAAHPYRPPAIVAIAVEKGLGAVAMGAGAVLALTHRGINAMDPVQHLVAARLFDDPDSAVLRWLARHLPTLPVHVTFLFGLALVLWALLFGAEAVGVWNQRPWGELMVIVETVVFLPFSLWRLATHPGVFGVAVVVLNLLILVLMVRLYLMRHRADAGAVAPRRSLDQSESRG